MTAAAPADTVAASRLVAALEHAWAAIRRHDPEVPRVVIVVASGSDPRRQAGDPTRAGQAGRSAPRLAWVSPRTSATPTARISSDNPIQAAS
jgi:hypothetical protein